MVLSYSIRQKSALCCSRYVATPTEAFHKKIFIKKNHVATLGVATHSVATYTEATL